ncbi:hypothetical protein GCM10010994_18610 [Chelatococcus reniformis]|uniref:Uncharacterized protein n=2 Tax=Chelatococcus reniformis TaxID=1494448 RepID=A0A916U5I5_9HYPH|nr:hypothetical protein GCM10010994_18610 [Chelatococcus reniformis]
MGWLLSTRPGPGPATRAGCGISERNDRFLRISRLAIPGADCTIVRPTGPVHPAGVAIVAFFMSTTPRASHSFHGLVAFLCLDRAARHGARTAARALAHVAAVSRGSPRAVRHSGGRGRIRMSPARATDLASTRPTEEPMMEMTDLNEFVAPDTATAAIVDAIVKVTDTTGRVDQAVFANLLSQCETLNEFQLLQAASSLLQSAIGAS